MFSLEGRNAVVTGSAAGLGRGIAVALARQGANVAICDLPGVPVEAAREEAAACGVKVLTVEMDVCDEEAVNRGMDVIAAEFKTIDIICCNAGTNTVESIEDISTENWDRHFDINVRGAMLPLKKALPLMKAQNYGRVILTASTAGLVGRPGQPAYCSTKGALIAMARGLALDYAEYGITVNCIAPTFVLTELARKRLEDPSYRDFVLGMIPTRRLATLEDVGSAAAFLASEEAGMTTGHVLTVDGGWTAQ